VRGTIVICFVDICGIVDYRCLHFLFISTIQMEFYANYWTSQLLKLYMNLTSTLLNYTCKINKVNSLHWTENIISRARTYYWRL